MQIRRSRLSLHGQAGRRNACVERRRALFQRTAQRRTDDRAAGRGARRRRLGSHLCGRQQSRWHHAGGAAHCPAGPASPLYPANRPARAGLRGDRGCLVLLGGLRRGDRWRPTARRNPASGHAVGVAGGRLRPCRRQPPCRGRRQCRTLHPLAPHAVRRRDLAGTDLPAGPFDRPYERFLHAAAPAFRGPRPPPQRPGLQDPAGSGAEQYRPVAGRGNPCAVS